MYKLFRVEMIEIFKLHRESLQNYLAFVAVILGATIAGTLQISSIGWIGVIVILGPILNVFVCLLAIRMCNRFYLGILERITISAKLESILGIEEYKLTEVNQGNKTSFFKDIYILPERWMRGRQCDTAEEFIQQRLNAGVNRLAKLIFLSMIVVNILLVIVIIFAVFLQ